MLRPRANARTHYCGQESTRWGLSRRELLRQSAVGFGSLALAGLLSGQQARAERQHDLMERAPHFPAKAKRIIFLFMHGGPSHVDTFDYKPQLQKDDNKPLPFSLPRVVSAKTGNLLKSPFRFSQCGESGIHVSEVFPHLAKRVDDLCFIHSVHGSNSRHGAALLELHTGSDTFIRPSMGSWLSYGLGSENQNLPGYITICPSLTHGGANNWGSAFLPAIYQGTPVGNAGTPSSKAKIPFIGRGKGVNGLQRLELDLLKEINEKRLAATGPDSDLESRIESFELAYRMQAQAPQLQDISGESEQTLRMYGIDKEPTRDFGLQCLMARRFAENGVRFVQLSHSYKWDQHGDLQKSLRNNAKEVDQPISALLIDLKRRGLLEDTIVWWGGEFGRTPVAQGRDGRDHNPHACTMFLAGGGIKPGIRYGETDEYGYYAVRDKVHFHDLHATLLHLMGLDHTRLTYRYAGRDFRLTDVHGEVVDGVLA